MNNIPNVMTDLETMGTGNDAVIVAIGAVKFMPMAEPGTFVSEFSANVEIGSAIESGLRVDGSTIAWWLRQEDAARTAFLEDPEPLGVVLAKFMNWFGSQSLPTWGNGSTFDCTILGSAFDKCNFPRPWKFYDEMCYRTVRKFFPNVERVRPAVAHRALDDAKAQAEHLQRICHSHAANGELERL